MGRPSTTRSLAVWMNGEQVGRWTVTSRSRHEFHYSPAWLEHEGARPLSLSMPLRDPEVPYQGEIVEAYFDNLLPDSAEIRQRLQRRCGARSTAVFDLLAEIGRDCVGAVQLLPPDAKPEGIHQIDGEALDEAGVAEALRAAVSSSALGQRERDDFRISIAGAQEKTALLRHQGAWLRPRKTTPTTHIFKLPLGRVGGMQADLSASVENEWLCSLIVRAFGLPIAACEMAAFEDQSCLIVERFDRRMAPDRSWWMRLPQEDLCQATATPPGRKYQADGGPGIAACLEVLSGARDALPARRRFFQSQVLFWLLAAPDGHAKNFSLCLESGGRFSSTPLYDVLSAYPVLGHGRNLVPPQRLTMAMAVWGRNRHYRWQDIRREHWRSTARDCGLGAEVDGLIDELLARTPSVVAEVQAQLPPRFPEQIAESILTGLSRAAGRLS